MSFFFGGGGKKVKPQFTGLAAQTSTNAVPVALVWGQNRIAPNIIWQGDFKSHKQKQKAGKGGGGSVTTYTYSGSYQLGLCWGTINGIARVWKDQSKETSYAALGFSLFTGTNPQAPWGYLTSNHPTKALGYPDIALLSVANYDLGNSNALAQHSFEIKGLLWNTGIGGLDAEPAAVIEDFLVNPVYGVRFDMSIVDQDSLFSTPAAPTTGDSAFQTYCQAMGFAFSPALISQQAAGEILERWASLFNTAIVYTGYSIKFHPYGPDTVTANGVTYLPDFPIRYQLGPDDYIHDKGEDPIQFNRSDPADAFNKLSMIIANRDNEYNELPIPWQDQGLIDQFGERPEENMDAKEITDPVMAAIMVALIGQRKAYIRNTFSFTLSPQYCRLEPMDVLECTDIMLGTFNVLIKEINEDDEDMIQIVAEEYPSSVSSAPVNSQQPGSNDPVNTAVSPGPVNPPIIFEPPSSLSGVPQVWAAVSGGNGTVAQPNWGGCFVWLSTDNITYNNIGEIDTPARQGKLTAILPTYGGANPDAVNTLKVTMAMSDGELSDAASAADAAAGVTLSYVESVSGYELLSYEGTTLTGADAYDLTSLYRKLYGTAVAAHAVGDDFARLDEAIFKFDLPEEYVGIVLYLKFQSYNIFGGGTEDLSGVTAYTYTPTGAGFGTGVGGLPSIPTGFSGSAGGIYAKVTWTQNPANDNVTGYQVWRATGSGQPFGSATLIGTTTAAASEYTDSAVTGGQAYTYFLVAVNSVGSSTNTAGINLTPSTGTTPFGFAFGPKTPVASKILAAFDTPIAWTMPVSLTDSQGTIVASDTAAAAAPSADTDFDIQSPPGSSIATMRFAASSLTATFINAVGDSIPIGQMLYIVAPAGLNGMTGAIAGSIKGTR